MPSARSSRGSEGNGATSDRGCASPRRRRCAGRRPCALSWAVVRALVLVALAPCWERHACNARLWRHLDPASGLPLTRTPPLFEPKPADLQQDFQPRCTRCGPMRAKLRVGEAEHDYEWAFHVHVPKTGGTAMRTLNHAKGGCHVTVRQVFHYNNASGQGLRPDGRKIRTFATIRHPLDRFIAAVYHQWFEKATFKDDGKLPDDGDLMAMADVLEGAFLTWPSSPVRFRNLCWWAPQVQWLVNNELKVTVDWIMKFETFGDDYAELVKEVELRPLYRKKINHHKVKDYGGKVRKHWCTYIGTPLAEKIKQLYAIDYEAFRAFYHPDVCISNARDTA